MITLTDAQWKTCKRALKYAVAYRDPDLEDERDALDLNEVYDARDLLKAAAVIEGRPHIGKRSCDGTCRRDERDRATRMMARNTGSR